MVTDYLLSKNGYPPDHSGNEKGEPTNGMTDGPRQRATNSNATGARFRVKQQKQQKQHPPRDQQHAMVSYIRNITEKIK